MILSSPERENIISFSRLVGSNSSGVQLSYVRLAQGHCSRLNHRILHPKHDNLTLPVVPFCVTIIQVYILNQCLFVTLVCMLEMDDNLRKDNQQTNYKKFC